jgi:hypothetical protein
MCGLKEDLPGDPDIYERTRGSSTAKNSDPELALSLTAGSSRDKRPRPSRLGPLS